MGGPQPEPQSSQALDLEHAPVSSLNRLTRRSHLLPSAWAPFFLLQCRVLRCGSRTGSPALFLSLWRSLLSCKTQGRSCLYGGSCLIQPPGPPAASSACCPGRTLLQSCAPGTAARLPGVAALGFAGLWVWRKHQDLPPLEFCEHRQCFPRVCGAAL